jgi:hypothetical protein
MATAGILAAVILFVMLFTVGTSYVIFVNSANRLYSASLVNQANRVQALGNEGVQVSTVLVTNDPSHCSTSPCLGFYINNTAGPTVNMTGVLVLDSRGNILKCGGVGLPGGASCGNTYPALPVNVNRGRGSPTIDTGYAYSSGTVAVEVFTARGNTFSATFPPSGPPYASQAQSIGALTANIQTFKWLKPTGDQQTGALVGGYPVTGISPFPQYYVPVVITNNQGSATPTTFQQKVTWNPSSYSTYEASDLGNVRFCLDTACSSPLFAWLESCASSCSPSATSATAWVQLTSSISGSGGMLTIYMVLTPTGTEFDGNYWGEAPTLSATYGQYDNGANVFSFYDAFAGQQLSSKWSTVVHSSGGTVTVNNGATFSASGSNDYVFVWSSAKPYPSIAEAYMVSRDSGTDPALGVSTSSGYNQHYLYSGYEVDRCCGNLYLNGETSGSSTTVVSQSENFNPGTWKLVWSATGTESASDGSVVLNGTSSNPSIGNYGIYVGHSNAGGSPGNDVIQWARMRAYPPGNRMPSVAFGTLVSTGGSQVIFSAVFADEDTLGRGVTLWPESCVAVVTVVPGSQQSSSVLSFYIVDGINSNTLPTGIVPYNSTKNFIHLNYNTPVTVYFGASVPKGSTMVPIKTPPSPFMILVSLSGQFDDKTLYGQTIAFPSGIATTTSGSLSAVSGAKGDTITVTGNGFSSGVKGMVGWIPSNGQVVLLTKFTTTSSGTLSGVSFTVPNYPQGYYIVVVTDYTNSIFFTFYHK